MTRMMVIITFAIAKKKKHKIKDCRSRRNVQLGPETLRPLVQERARPKRGPSAI